MGDGVEALRLIDTGHPPNLVVLDLGLPRLSGHDVQRELASRIATRDMPIIVVTGDSRDVTMSSMTSVLRKPINATALIAAVQNSLGHAP